MLCEVTSSARCSVSRPRSDVFNPMKVEIGIRPCLLSLVVDDVKGGMCGGGSRARAGPVAAALRCPAEHPREVLEEGQLLAHERAVDRVLALDLGQQAAQL